MMDQKKQDKFLALWRAESPTMQEMDVLVMWRALSESAQDTILRMMRGEEGDQNGK
jgi:hypothetical protein